MPHLQKSNSQKEGAIILLAALLVVGFIGFVLYSNYLSNLKLRESTLRLIRQKVQTHASDLHYFSNLLKKDIHDLASGSKVALFFENKALGMSMEYGLRFNLLTLSSSFQQVIVNRKNNSRPVFNRILFTDHLGDTLVDTESTQPSVGVSDKLKTFSLTRPSGFYLVTGRDQNHQDVLYTTPFYFKGTYAGQITAWIIAENVYSHFIIANPNSGKHSGIVYATNRILNDTYSHPSTTKATLGPFYDEAEFQYLLKDFQSGNKIAVIKVPIQGTPFALFEIWSLEQLFGKTSAQTLLLAMVVLALAVLGTMTYVVWIATQNRVLRMRVHESHINEKEIAAKNIALQREIEDRKRAEMEGARLATRLQHAEKMEAMGTLAGGVAHDLNNILSAIVGYPELLLLEIPEDSPYRSAILNIKKSGEKAGAIVQDLLNLARRAVLDMNVVNLEKIIEEYLISPECKKLLQYHPNVEIVTHFEDELLPISGSPVHLSKAIMNLVSNAAEAMPEGGTITVSISNTLINAAFARFASIAKGDYLKLKVSDTGTGIPQKDIENIFQPFYTKKIMGRSGTGLGMTVVWGTVKDHNGYIDVQSTEGKGTIFSLYLPATEESVTELKQHHNLEDYIGHGEKILIVDDMPAQRDIAKMMLEKLGYDATTVSSGDEAVTYISNNAVEVVLLDMLMAPGIDGLETYQQIKAIHPKQKAVIASGFSETNRVKAAIELGANGYVRKPYTLETIGIAVHRALDSN